VIDSAPALELRGITKRFGDLVANDGIDFDVRRGEVHALLGENGAGKTTFMRIAYGLTQADAGEVRVEGLPCIIRSPRDAISAGIGMVTQHFALVGPMSVAENLALGRSRGLRLDLAAARRRAASASDRFGIRIDPSLRVADLSVGQQQRVEIVKALSRDCRVLILDEPTAVLVPDEVNASSPPSARWWPTDCRSSSSATSWPRCAPSATGSACCAAASWSEPPPDRPTSASWRG